jgi:GNAT superfamily N-acetyltransferase
MASLSSAAMTSTEPAAPPPSFELRRAEPVDMRAAFSIFRRAIVAKLHRMGIVDSPTVDDAAFEQAWSVRRPWVEHLWRTSAENWVAIDAEGRPIGWALSIQRGSMLELTFFFVDPERQSKGVGKALLERAFPLGRGPHRSIVATLDPRALSLYLRFGVRHAATIVDFEAPPRPVSVETDLTFEVLDASDRSIELIADVEEALLGHRREIDTRLLLEQRPAWIARRGGTVAGFAFGDRGDELTGPIGALDPIDIPAMLAHVENEAALAGRPNIYFSTPLANDTAVKHLLGRGFTLDPFVVTILADDLSMQLDRWIHTGLSYIL